MRKLIEIVLLALIVLLSTLTVPYVDASPVLRANDQEEGDERQAALNNHADIERELQRRRNNGRGRGRGGSGKGKGGGSKSSKGSKSGRFGGIRFLPDRYDPIPFVNCIPLPPGYIDRSRKMGGMGGGGSSKGKGGKGKGTRRNRRSAMRGRSQRNLQRNGRNGRNGMGRHHHSHRHDGRIRHGRNRGHGNRMGGRRHGDGTDHHHHPHSHQRRMRMFRLPFCPPDETLFPTTLPSFTPIPTATPLPSITPFPSFTPIPTEDGDGRPSDDGPGSPGSPSAPGAPTVPGAPTAAGGPGGGSPGGAAPVAIPPGTVRVLVESQLEYGPFEGETFTDPTQAEIDGVLAQTDLFYNQLISAAYPNLDSFDATFVASSFDAGAEYPIKIDFDANAFFPEGTTIPTASDIFQILEDADYMNYITEYVWMSEPEGTQFFNTQQVAYNARVIPT